jgi:type IV secretory pathway VirB2 component (pilin)
MLIDLQSLNFIGFGDLKEFAFFVVQLAMSLSVLIVVASLVITGFKYIFSMGDEEKVKSATRSLTFSIVGLVIVFLSPRIIEFIINEVLTLN